MGKIWAGENLEIFVSGISEKIGGEVRGKIWRNSRKIRERIFEIFLGRKFSERNVAEKFSGIS